MSWFGLICPDLAWYRHKYMYGFWLLNEALTYFARQCFRTVRKWHVIYSYIVFIKYLNFIHFLNVLGIGKIRNICSTLIYLRSTDYPVKDCKTKSSNCLRPPNWYMMAFQIQWNDAVFFKLEIKRIYLLEEKWPRNLIPALTKSIIRKG